MFRNKRKIILAGLLILLVTACAQTEEIPIAIDPPNSTGMANPASVYCENLGYETELIEDAEGNQDENCIFPDGTFCTSWDFLSGRCRPEMSFCEQQGSDLVEAPNIGDCFFPDGSFCLESDYAEGLCQPGDNLAVEEEIGDDIVEEKVFQVQGWMGRVVTSDVAEIDDYLLLSSEMAASFGLVGMNAEIDVQIEELRDAGEPGRYANFWGVLSCGVADYNGCQLVVERIRSGIEITDAEDVSFTGMLKSNPEGSQFQHFFELSGVYPIGFGIASFIDTNGDPVYKEEIEDRVDSGQLIEVVGEMICGVPDVNACQIQVEYMYQDGILIDPN